MLVVHSGMRNFSCSSLFFPRQNPRFDVVCYSVKFLFRNQSDAAHLSLRLGRLLYLKHFIFFDFFFCKRTISTVFATMAYD